MKKPAQKQVKLSTSIKSGSPQIEPNHSATQIKLRTTLKSEAMGGGQNHSATHVRV